MGQTTLSFGTQDQSDSIKKHLVKITDDFELDHATIAIKHEHSQDLYVTTTLPDEWREYYIAGNHMDNDPRIHVALHAAQPVDWKLFNSFDTKEVCKLYEMHGHGNQGIVIPTLIPSKTQSLLSLTKHCDDQTWEDHKVKFITKLNRAARNLHRIAVDVYGLDKIKIPLKLSDREIEILQLIAQGHVVKQVAELMNLTPKKIEYSLASIRDRMNVRTTAQALVLATSRNLIAPV